MPSRNQGRGNRMTLEDRQELARQAIQTSRTDSPEGNNATVSESTEPVATASDTVQTRQERSSTIDWDALIADRDRQIADLSKAYANLQPEYTRSTQQRSALERELEQVRQERNAMYQQLLQMQQQYTAQPQAYSTEPAYTGEDETTTVLRKALAPLEQRLEQLQRKQEESALQEQQRLQAVAQQQQITAFVNSWVQDMKRDGLLDSQIAQIITTAYSDVPSAMKLHSSARERVLLESLKAGNAPLGVEEVAERSSSPSKASTGSKKPQFSVTPEDIAKIKDPQKRLEARRTRALETLGFKSS